LAEYLLRSFSPWLASILLAVAMGGDVVQYPTQVIFLISKNHHSTKPTVILSFSTTASFQLWPTLVLARSVTNYLWYYFMVLFLVPLNSTSNSAKTSSKNTVFLRGFGTIRGTIQGTIFVAEEFSLTGFHPSWITFLRTVTF
jgi:hypothetical protein